VSCGIGFADQIVVINRGAVVDRGTHDELVMHIDAPRR
jgi:ABC-type transport system involved in Fe-S cluster assembly fused permease/ATPase subunit